MDCYYINMDAATDRRRTIESSFAASRQPGWELIRYPAVNGQQAELEGASGKLSPAEKGCFLSHRGILSQAPDDGSAIFIAEDDVEFGKRSCLIIDELIRCTEPDTWDLMFTDACIPGATDMIQLVQTRRSNAGDGKLLFFNMQGLGFAGSTAYVVNGRSKRKILGLLEQAVSLDMPYDLYLRQLIHSGQLKSLLVFPFLTTLSQAADRSSIHGEGELTMDIVRNAFRRLMWMERDLGASALEARAISDRFCDDDAILAGALLGAMTSSELHPK